MDEFANKGPQASLNFDVERNPQDMQFMTDALMYAPMLKNMDEEQRAEKWPEVVQKLEQVSPKASQMLDPTLPPRDEDLDAIMGAMPKSQGQGQEGAEGGFGTQAVDQGGQRQRYLDDQVQRQIQGKEPISPEEFNNQQGKKPEEMTNDEIEKGAKAEMEGGAKQVFFGSDNTDEDPRFKGAPKGWMWVDPNDKAKGLVDLKKKPLTPEQAGKLSSMLVAKANLPIIKQTLWNKDGSLNRTNVALAQYAPAAGGPAFPEAQQLKHAWSTLIEAGLRSETGATINKSERPSIKKRYTCYPTDSSEVCLQKYVSANLFVNKFVNLVEDIKPGETARFNHKKADDMDAATAASIQAYRKDWVEQAKKANPNLSYEQLNNAFNLKVINLEPSFVKKMTSMVKSRMKKGK